MVGNFAVDTSAELARTPRRKILSLARSPAGSAAFDARETCTGA